MSSINASVQGDERARLDALFATLEDRSGELEAVSQREFAGRRARLADLLAAAGADAFLCEGGSTMTYLCGVEWGHSERLFALVVCPDGSHFFVAPEFELARVQLVTAEVGGGVIGWREHEGPYAPTAAALAERGARRLVLEPWIRHRFALGFAEALGSTNLLGGVELLTTLRGCKDEHELALLRHAQELTQSAICAVAETLEPGVNSTEISKRLTVAQERLGLTHIWDLSLIGPAAAYPHGDGREATLRQGDVLLVDTGGRLHGYCSDCTRTWVIGGRPDERVTRIWNVVRDAQRAAFEVMSPGTPCGDVDRAARAVIEGGGFGPGYSVFRHRLGHGIGLDGHEDPYFDGGSTVPMAPGMTFSNEPGIYLDGDLGLRIEDIVAVSADGADHFGSWQAGPQAPHPA